MEWWSIGNWNKKKIAAVMAAAAKPRKERGVR